MVKNIGEGLAGPSALKLKVGGEGTSPIYAVPPLDPGASLTVTRAVTISVPIGLVCTATAVCYDQLAESNESNNSVLDYVSVNKAAATVVLDNLTQTYTGSALMPTATTNPPGLAITWTGAPQTNAGSYPVTATVNDANYQGSASGTFTINKAVATVVLSNLNQTYDGTEKTVTSETDPAGLNVTFTYNGSDVPPVDAGIYSVVATVQDTNYEGCTQGSLIIAKADQYITFNPLPDKTYGDPDFMVNATAPLLSIAALSTMVTLRLCFLAQ